MYREQLVATRPLAHPHRKFFGNCGWALALALGRRWFRYDGNDRAFRQNNQRNPPPIPLALLPATRLPLIAATPRTTRLTTTPPPGCLPARFAAIATLRMSRTVGTLAPFEQAAPTTALPGWGLCRLAIEEILKGAQGSCRSRRSSLGDELLLPPRRFILITIQQLNRYRIDPPRREPHYLVPRSTPRALARAMPRFWTCGRALLTR